MWDKCRASLTVIAIVINAYMAWVIVSTLQSAGAETFALVVSFWVLMLMIDLLVSLSKSARRIWKAAE